MTNETRGLPAPGELHLWLAELDFDGEVAQALRLLHPEEQDRARRMASTIARRRFVLTRALLRHLLEGYLGEAAAEIPIASRRGKPELQGAAPLLSFNVAHSHRRAAIVFANGNKVGVDVEYRDRRVDHERLTRRVFSDAERLAYQELEPDARQRVFFDAWSRKEAVLKACGLGLRSPPREAEVSMEPGEPRFMVRSAGQRWHVQGVSVHSDYAGAIASDREILDVRRWDITSLRLDDMLQDPCSS